MARLFSALPLVVPVLALAACTGDPPPPVPTTIDARIAPDRLWYHTNQQVTLTGLVHGLHGEEIEDVEVIWTVEPADFATLGAAPEDPRQARFTLGHEGRGTFTGCVPPLIAESEPTLCDTIAVRVDDGMPVLEVSEPAPGAELGPDPIVVRGSVTDRSMVRVFVNGTLAELDEVGQFEATLDPLFGVNHLVVSASDGLTEVSEVEMDVVWADEYVPAVSDDGQPELRLDDGMALWLGQSFFDDTVPLDPAAQPIVTHDLADLLELVVARIDLNELIPDPVVSRPELTLRIDSASIAQPHAELDLTETGADLFVRVGQLRATTAGVFAFEGEQLPLDGTITASVVAFARLTVRKTSESAPVEVTLGNLSVGIETVEGRFANAEVAAIFRIAEGLLRGTLEQAVVNAVRATLQETVPVVLRDALAAIDTALADRSIPIETELFPPVTIRLDGRIRSLDTVFRRELQADLRATVGTDSLAVHPESRGVARLAEGVMPPPFFRDGSVQIGLRMVLLNALLHALWNSGMLEIDVGALLPDSIRGLVSEARLIGRMAPVVRPPRADESEDMMLSLGQLELELTFMGEPVRFGVSVDAGVNVDVASNRIALGLDETPTMTVWTLQAPSDPRLLTSEVVRTTLLDLWPDLRAVIVDGLSFDLPLPAVGDLGGIAPDLAGLSLGLQMTERLRPREGMLFLDAQLIGTLPPP